jgi:hypothetical protein
MALVQVSQISMAVGSHCRVLFRSGFDVIGEIKWPVLSAWQAC